MPILDVPGVYIDEVTSPGVIAGVGTSTAAFIGPALAGPINQARRISSFDEFLQLYGQPQADGTINPYIVTPRVFYLAHGVRGFYENGGKQAYIVRVGTARAAAWDIVNGNTPTAETAFRLQARQEGLSGNNITIQVQAASATGAAGVSVATATANVTAVNGINLTVNDASNFRVGDVVTESGGTENFGNRATITQIQGNNITLSNTIAGLAASENIRIASILPEQTTFRLAATTGIFPGTVAQISGDDADNPGTTVNEYVLVQTVDAGGFVTV
ncbi:MAG: hypothetical protein KJZ78_22650, partial [Bryobacteraceae bacterium]|nr:hypothetical protein [Bryobacteraceae bacterium]